jgi:hypothetical protein
MGASPRNLNYSAGLADMASVSDRFPLLPPEPDAQSGGGAGRALRDKEIETADLTRYCAMLLLCPDGFTAIVLYSFGFVGGGYVTQPADAFNEPQLRAIIYLHKATLLSPSSLNAFNIHDETGLIWSIYPEGIDDDDARGGCKRWLEAIRTHIPADQKGPRVVSIVYQGHLAKRGLLNTAFRKRWFVLNSKNQVSWCDFCKLLCSYAVSLSILQNIKLNFTC